MRSERASAVPEDHYLAGAPELVVELVSPSYLEDDLEGMRSICLANGGLSFWAVYPNHKTRSVLKGNEDRTYGLADVISRTPLQLEISVQDVFIT